jgi:hypothetical protein
MILQWNCNHDLAELIPPAKIVETKKLKSHKLKEKKWKKQHKPQSQAHIQKKFYD